MKSPSFLRRRSLFGLPTVLVACALTVASHCPAGSAEAVRTPPNFLMVSGINEAGELLVQSYRNVTRLPATPQGKPSGSSYRIQVPVSLKDVLLMTGGGKPLTLGEARKLVGLQGPVLVMSGGEKPDPAYLRVLSRDVLICVFSGDAPKFERPRWPVEKPVGEKGLPEP